MEKTHMQKKAEELLYNNENGLEKIKKSDLKRINEFNEGYKNFLSSCKTERECVSFLEERAVKAGFEKLENKEKLNPGDKIYVINRDKSIMLCVIGKNNIGDGANMVAAHIDSPRLDLKPNPLFEMENISYFKTHYYGGIKKYQWLTMPLSIHGVVVKNNGEKVNITIGEEEGDPVFCVTDLLPHLAQSQMTQTASKLIDGEKLNVILGTMPVDDEKIKDKVKLYTMLLLNEKYGITEKDFITADIEVVPAYKAKDVGFDRSMVGSYGQDDRVCAYTAFEGILEVEKPEKTAICYLVDKEEIGSCDSTGMKSRYFEDILAEICSKTNKEYTDLQLRKALANTMCLSADVTAAFDPNFPEVCERNNSAYLNRGIALMKYSGARGKSGTNEATAEFTRKVIDVFDKNGVNWQTGELGKVDEGGGGTVAQYLAVLNIHVIDCGVPLLSMHSPFEIASKYDVYMAYKGYNAFYMA